MAIAVSRGLDRLGITLQGIGYLFFCLVAYVVFMSEKNDYGAAILDGFIGAAFWVPGWIIRGFAKQD